MSALSKVTDLTARLPTEDEIGSAAEAAAALARVRESGGQVKIHGARGDSVTIAPALCDLLVDLLGHVAQGQMVTLVPRGAHLTTQEAADMLNVSRPYLSKLLKEGVIPFIQVGTHRRVRHDDLMAFMKERDSLRRDALTELVELGQEFDAS